MKRLFLIPLLFIIPQFTLAATLSLTPKSFSVNADKSFTLNVLVSSSDQAINAVSANINFPANLLRVTKIDTGSSIIKFWATEPSYSNSAGTVNLEGVIFNPGYIGSSGKVATITFVPTRTGSAQISFASGSVLANDGQGTEVLSGTASAQITIAEPVVVTPVPIAEPVKVDVPTPVISSSSHPNQGEKYGVKEAIFSWEAPPGVEAVRLSYGREPSDSPAVLYEPAISNKNISISNDGTYYFNAQFKKGGVWGEAAHYKFIVSSDIVPTEVVATSTEPAIAEPLAPREDTQVTMTVGEYTDPAELTAAVEIIAILLIIIFFLVLTIRKKKKVESEIILPLEVTKDMGKIIGHAFDVLSWDVKRQLNILNSVKKERELSQAEKIIEKNLQESLRLAEEHIKNELKPKKKKIIHTKKNKR